MTGIHRRRKRVTTDQSYNRMLRRLIVRWGDRASEDIEANLVEYREHRAAFDDAANLAIWRANRIGGVSINRIAASLRVSKQAAHKRVIAGERIAARQQRDRELTAPPIAMRKAQQPRQLGR